MYRSQRRRIQHEKGYTWLHFHTNRASKKGLLVTCIVIGAGCAFYAWYAHFGHDVAPDSSVGLIFAIAGTLCFLLASMGYTRSRTSRKRGIGQLNNALNWHVFFALIGLALLIMHSFGNFNAKTGTYALYGLIVLMVSGFVGRFLDRVVPRLIAAEVDSVLTAQGEDRIEHLSQRLQTLTVSQPSIVMASANKYLAEIQRVQHAMQREQFYRALILYWRRLHLLLAIITIALIIWHLVYVVQLFLIGAFHV